MRYQLLKHIVAQFHAVFVFILLFDELAGFKIYFLYILYRVDTVYYLVIVR